METNKQGYYAVPNKPLSLSFATHPGKLTKKDLIANLKTAIENSNECGEDWIADLKECWYQREGMIMPTEDESLLEDEKEISFQIGEMLDPERSDWRTEMILKEAGVGEELQPLNEEQMEYLMDGEEIITLRQIITSELPYEEPYL
jgi:hypothetical protein